MKARKSKTARRSHATPPAHQVLFSEMIDEWLRAGERLSDQSVSEGARPPDDRAPAALEGWRARVVELWHAIVDRHRLEALVAVGLLPLMLWLAMLTHLR